MAPCRILFRPRPLGRSPRRRRPRRRPRRRRRRRRRPQSEGRRQVGIMDRWRSDNADRE